MHENVVTKELIYPESIYLEVKYLHTKYYKLLIKHWTRHYE